MVTTIMRGVAALAVVAVLAACDPIDDPNPQPDHRGPTPTSNAQAAGPSVTMHWYSNEPYRAKWKITKRDGSLAQGVNAQNPDGFDKGRGELVANGAFDHTITLGDVELIFTLVIVVGSRDAIGWVKITRGPGDRGEILASEDVDQSTRQAICNWFYQPKKR